MTSDGKPIIGMMLETGFPPDIRVEKEARALVAGGYRVHLLCVGDGQRPANEEIDGLIVHRSIRYSSKLVRQLQLVMARARFYSSEWVDGLKQFIRDNSIDVLHVHDLPLAGNALKVREHFPGLRIVVDLHENFAAGAAVSVAYERGFKGWLLRTLYAYPRWQKFEGEVLQRADHIITVVDEMKQRLLDQHSADPDKITVISNYEDPAFVDMSQEVIEKNHDQFVLSYIGSFSPARGLETAIKGMALLRDYPIRLQVVGRGTPVVEAAYRKIIENNDLHDSVELLGWQPFERVPALMRAADVGLVPHARNEQTDHTIPHKLFQYMMLGLPLIVSTARPLARIVGDSDAGEIFEAGSPESFAEAVLRLYRDKSRYDHCSRCGIGATLNGTLNWSCEGGRLVKMYEKYPWA